MADSASRRSTNERYDAKLTEQGIRKVTVRCPYTVRNAMRARALHLGISENEACIRAFRAFTEDTP